MGGQLCSQVRCGRGLRVWAAFRCDPSICARGGLLVPVLVLLMQLALELCEMGGSARSVLAHQGLAALGDLLHCCPAAVAADKEAVREAASILMENAKKNKVAVGAV